VLKIASLHSPFILYPLALLPTQNCSQVMFIFCEKEFETGSEWVEEIVDPYCRPDRKRLCITTLGVAHHL
jgi:hypothetical protein